MNLETLQRVFWSDDYANHVHPWGGDDRVQSGTGITIMTACDSECSTTREQSYSYQGQDVDIMSFHEGLNGGINARGVEMTR